MRIILSALIALLSVPALAAAPDVKQIVDAHVLPRYATLAEETANLQAAAQADCSPDSVPLVAAFHDAFDAWVGVSHLRFGPSEKQDRAFALAFWPDPRGATPRALGALLRDVDPAVFASDAFVEVSVAARGFYALEFLLFDPQFAQSGDAAYRCALIRAIATDIASNAAAILKDWRDGYGDMMSHPGNDTYRTPREAAQQFYTALLGGLAFTSDTRLGRPMGSFDRPRPNRAEARRSERSLRHVILSLSATEELAGLLSTHDPEVAKAFDKAIKRARGLDDPVFAGVADPQGRLRVEVLQQNIGSIRQLLSERVGPSLGIAAGFNALDGD